MTASTPVRAGRREWAGLAVLALPTLLLSLDMSVLYLAVPHLSADLRPSGTQLLWITDIYGFLLAGFLVTMGALGDRVGRRRLLLLGAVGFGAASVLAAYSTTPGMLIAARALLGVAGATQMPSTLALIGNLFLDGGQRARAIGVWASCIMAGMAIGPVVGGALLQHFWWGSVFLMGVPVMGILLVAGPLLLPEYRDSAAGRIDLVSVALSLATVLLAVYGLKEIAEDGRRPVPFALVAVAAAVGWWFVRRQRSLTDPLVDLRLFRNRTFGLTLGVLLVGGAAVSGVELLVTMHLQLVAGLSPAAAGWCLVPPALAVLAGSLTAPVLAARFGAFRVLTCCLGIGAAGLVTVAVVAGSAGAVGVLTGFTVAFLGIGSTGAVGTDLVVGAAPPERAGSASSLSETSAELGIALGVAVFGSVGFAVYRGGMSEVQSAPGAARDSLAAAARVADRLPGDAGDALLGTARDAFTSGLTVAAFVTAVVVLSSTVLTAAFGRGRTTGCQTRNPRPSCSSARATPPR